MRILLIEDFATLFLGIFLAIICCKTSFANNNLQMINSLSALEGEAFGSKNHKEVFNQFIEKPLSKKSSIGLINQASRIDSKHNESTISYAINSIEAFHRYKVLSLSKLGVTMQNSFRFPGIYNENKYLGLMPKQSDYELRFLFAYNMPDRLVNTVTRNETPFFVRAEVAYRRKFSNPFDEARFRLLLGIKINSEFSLLLQDELSWNLKSKSDALDNSYSNPSFSKHANQVANFSLLYHLNRDTAIQAGYVRRAGGNAPFHDDKGVIVGLWNSF